MTQAHTSTMLTPEQKSAYERDGYLVIPGLIENVLVEKVRGRIDALAQGAAPSPEGVQRMEEPAVTRGDVEVKSPGASLRKLEGVPLVTDPSIHKCAHHPLLLQVMKELLGDDLKLLRAAAMLKPPRVGSPKGLHQDAAYYPIEPQNHIAAWIALDPATKQNGCMEVLPGAHKQGYQAHEEREYDTDVVIEGTTDEEEGLVQLPMEPGDVLLTHCLTPHRSSANQSRAWRRALILAYMNAQSRYTVAEEERPPWVQSMHITGQEYPGCV